jgi:hypothetical protein
MAMQIAVNCKQHQAYQYGALHEAFTHTENNLASAGGPSMLP